MDDPAKIAQKLERNCTESLPAFELKKKIDEARSSSRPLRVKLGIDPTAPDIHLGHTVVLAKLAEFQALGHTVVLIIGDYTARVGDPSGRSTTRPMLTAAEIDRNAETFKAQAFKSLDQARTEVRFNSEWLDMSMEKLFELVRSTTVAQVLQRDDFAKRYLDQQPISMLELLYPLLQGYDSVAVEADVELGGTDQKFNLLMGREIQQAYGQSPQAVVTMPILPGTDGKDRMSKSLGNYVGITESPEEIFGKVMSIPDTAMATYYGLLLGTDVPKDEHPNLAKRSLASRLVERFHSADAAVKAEASFDRIHRQKMTPDLVEHEVTVDGDRPIHLPALLAEAFAMSTSEARRLIDQGGLKVDGDPLQLDGLDIDPSAVADKVVQAGKRRFCRVRVKGLSRP